MLAKFANDDACLLVKRGAPESFIGAPPGPGPLLR
jgi:hypothetical protein